MRYDVIDTFKVGDNTAVTLNAYGVGVDMKRPLIGEKGEKYMILGVGMSAGDRPDMNYPLDLLVKGKFEGRSAEVTTS